MLPRAAELTGAAEGANNVQYRYGFWLVLGLLAMVAAANARAATAPAPRSWSPVAARGTTGLQDRA